MSFLDTPLEILDEETYGELDLLQQELICKLDAVDVVLLENANEIFRSFMQQGTRIEKILKTMRVEKEHSIYLRSDTFDIVTKPMSEDKDEFDEVWELAFTSKNKKTTKAYIKDAVERLKTKTIHDDAIIYTVIGLQLEGGGHYGGIICDLSKSTVHVFDSMSYTDPFLDDEANYINSGTEQCFLDIAEKIFSNKDIKKLINKKLSYEMVTVEGMLQPTGGFEGFTSPVLKHANIKRRLKQAINIQNTDSQNHFCYIWSIWFCHIYLRGGLELFDEVTTNIASSEIIPLVVIKKYILGFVPMIGNIDDEEDEFFQRHFPRIWSNHKHPTENKFKLYSFKSKKPKTIQSCLDYSINVNDYEALKLLKSTNGDSVKKFLGCMDDDLSKYFAKLDLSDSRSSVLSSKSKNSNSNSDDSTSTVVA
jgi:hypothetical protein